MAAVVELGAHKKLLKLDQARVLSDVPGRLGTRIQYLALASGQRAYLKVAPRPGLEDLSIEHERLRWLRGRLPVPEVLGFVTGNQFDLLLISELPGTPAHRLDSSAREVALQVVADALHQIHAVAVSECPFRQTVQDEIAQARAMLERGDIDERGFSAANGIDPATGLAKVEELAAGLPELNKVWTHGDFCLPNVLVHDRRVGGIIDWGLARVGDPARDLAMLEGSLRYNFGVDSVAQFYEIWGQPPAQDLRSFFDLLDQFFTHLNTPTLSEIAT